MAKQQNTKYSYDEWIEQVRPDLRNTDQLTLMEGYIGQSSENGHVRVYSDESLNHFVEVPEDAIVFSVKLSPTESSLGGSKLWLRSDVVVTYGDPKAANRPKSTFLEGDLMQQYATQYGGGYDQTGGVGAYYGGQPEAAAQGAQYMATIQCPSNIICPPRTIAGPNCPPITIRPTIIRTFCAPRTCFKTICGLLSCVRTMCGPQTCIRTMCGPQTCIRTLCGPQTCLPILCGGIPCQFNSVAGPTGPITGPIDGPIIQPGGGFMGGQGDPNYMGGYYGTFNPYMM